MINWNLLKDACEERIATYEDAVNTSIQFGSLKTERKYARLIRRYQRLLYFIDVRTAIVKPKNAQL